MLAEDENDLNVKYKYKGTCVTCRKYTHKSKDCSHREGANLPKFNYCDKPGHVNKGFWKLKMVEYLPVKNAAIGTAIRDVTRRYQIWPLYQAYTRIYLGSTTIFFM